MYVCVSGGKKCSLFGKFGVLCFLETPVLRFSLLPYYRRISIYYFRNGCFNYEIEEYHRQEDFTKQMGYDELENPESNVKGVTYEIIITFLLES